MGQSSQPNDTIRRHSEEDVKRLGSRPINAFAAQVMQTDEAELPAAKAARAAATGNDRHVTTVLRDTHRQRSKVGEKAKDDTVTLKQEITLSVTIRSSRRKRLRQQSRKRQYRPRKIPARRVTRKSSSRQRGYRRRIRDP